MNSSISNKQEVQKAHSELQLKAALFDQLVEFIEDSVLGQLMSQTEKERRIPLARAKKNLAQ